MEVRSELVFVIEISERKLMVFSFAPVLCVVFDRKIVKEDEGAAGSKQPQVHIPLIKEANRSLLTVLRLEVYLDITLHRLKIEPHAHGPEREQNVRQHSLCKVANTAQKLALFRIELLGQP